jgi:hypothetical protein
VLGLNQRRLSRRFYSEPGSLVGSAVFTGPEGPDRDDSRLPSRIYPANFRHPTAKAATTARHRSGHPDDPALPARHLAMLDVREIGPQVALSPRFAELHALSGAEILWLKIAAFERLADRSRTKGATPRFTEAALRNLWQLGAARSRIDNGSDAYSNCFDMILAR